MFNLFLLSFCFDFFKFIFAQKTEKRTEQSSTENMGLKKEHPKHIITIFGVWFLKKCF